MLMITPQVQYFVLVFPEVLLVLLAGILLLGPLHRLSDDGAGALQGAGRGRQVIWRRWRAL
jgi:hypothetical protein